MNIAQRTLSAIVVFTLILTHILCVYEAIATCGYDDPEARDRALQDALVDLGKKLQAEKDAKKDFKEAEETLAHVKSMCYFYQVMLECEYGFSDTISHR